MSSPHTPDAFNTFGATYLPGHLGIQITEVSPGKLAAEMPVAPHLLAPNGYLHAGSVVTLADTCAGYDRQENGHGGVLESEIRKGQRRNIGSHGEWLILAGKGHLRRCVLL